MILPIQRLIPLALQSSNLDQFDFSTHIIAGDECILVKPKELGVDWNRNNLILRSLIYRKSDYYPVSLGHKKFVNYGEGVNIYDDPNKFPLNDWHIGDKEDGSLIIVSKYKGQLIVRTRGTVNAFKLDSGSELKQLFDVNHKIIDNVMINSEDNSLLFEHNSVVNPIVVKHNKPELVLLDVISHHDYSYYSKSLVDDLAKALAIYTPKKYSFTSIRDIISTCKQLRGKEGFVLSFDNNQQRIKLKSDWYLNLHRFKSTIRSFNNMMELFISIGKPDKVAFYNHIAASFDYELAEQSKDMIDKVIEVNDKINSTIIAIKSFLPSLAGLSKKEAAQKILAKYKNDDLDSLVFCLFNGKEIGNILYWKLVEVVKNK